jgi:8-oxo-dGTP diphosphatase
VGAFHPHLHSEPGCVEQFGDVRGIEKAEVDVHVISPPLVQVPDLRAHVEGDEEAAGGAQYPRCLVEGAAQVTGIEVDDRVEGDGGPELAVAGRQVQQVTLPELHLREPATTGLDHAIGQVDPDRARALPGEPGRHVPGATTEVGDRGPRFRLFHQAREERPVERLPGEFVVQPGRVLLGHGVVAAAYGIMVGVINHAASMPPLVVVAAAVVRHGRLLVVSKQAAPDVFYLPGGKPEVGEEPLVTLARELVEELGVIPVEPQLLGDIEATAALEDVPMRMTVYLAGIDGEPRPAAELADLRWVTGHEDDVRLAPAVRDHVLPALFGETGVS